MRALALFLVACGGSSEPPPAAPVSIGTEAQVQPESARDESCHRDLEVSATRQSTADMGPRLQHCYHSRVHRPVSVRIDVRLEVAPTGIPGRISTQLRTDGDVELEGSDALQECVRGEFAQMRFGVFEGDCAVARFPLVFVPRESAP